MNEPAGYVDKKRPCRICGRITEDRYQPAFQVNGWQIKSCCQRHAELIYYGKFKEEARLEA